LTPIPAINFRKQITLNSIFVPASTADFTGANMNSQKIISTAALALLISALTAQATSIKISSLPFNITTPGTYVLAADLSYPSQQNAAITIATSIKGPVVLDLKGHTLTGGGGYSIAVGIGYFAGSTVANASSITVQNGAVQNFGYGVWGETTSVYLTNIEVNSIAFHISQTPNNASAGVIFSQVDSSTVNNCSFFSADTGIEDNQSAGGNIYTNNSFVGTGECLTVIGQNNGVPTVLAHCRFSEPAN
jgi:hypothetical protein